MKQKLSLVCLVCNLILVASLTGQGLAKPEQAVRFATFNASLYRDAAGKLLKDLEAGKHPGIRKVAEIVQQVRPDVLLLNEFDFDPSGNAVKLLKEKYLEQSQNGQTPIEYEYVFSAESNTGIDSGFDLNHDGKTGSPDDAFGFGKHPGQYGMLVLSKYPIDAKAVRTFQKFLWKDLPGALLPIDPKTSKPWYDEPTTAAFRLSSKSHWDVPITVGEKTVHFLVCHPTPPVFDGAEDRNGLRNHDEIRFWAEYISGSESVYDDAGKKGGLKQDDSFVIAGDLNADPNDGDSRDRPTVRLLEHPLVQDPQPKSAGGVEQAEKQAQMNAKHKGDPALDTGDFGDKNVGNLRIDYVLPSKNLKVLGSGVFWPAEDKPEFKLVDCSDHRLVWVDVTTNGR
ncbi:MAG: endonuclease/exonuclease/phosphatase family protein [Planctomycetota bacterium]